MPEEDSGTGEMEHGEEVLDAALPARDEATEVVQPSKEALDLPATPRATEASTVLRGLTTTAAMGGDHLDAVGCHQLLIERIAVVAAVANQPRGEIREEARVEGGRDEVRLIR